MENTLENKAKFFGQYYGQERLKWHDKGVVLEVIWSDLNNDLKENHFLELKSISSISDEDAEEISKISISRDPISINIKRNESDYADIEIENISEHSTWTLFISGIDVYFKCGTSRNENDSNLILAVYDYLRSKGYALPYMDLSVEKLVEYGWIKLIV